MERVTMTLLDTLPGATVVLHTDGSEVAVCQGELQVLETQDGVIVLNVAPHFQYALSPALTTMKTADGRYVLPHSTPGSEYEVRVERVDVDSVAVLEYALKINSSYSVEKRTLKSRLSGLLKKGGQALKKGASWVSSRLKKKKSPEDSEEARRSEEMALQKIEESRQDNAKKFVLAAGAVSSLIAVASAIESQRVASPSAGPSEVQSALADSISLVKSTLQSQADAVLTEQLGLTSSQLMPLIAAGKTVAQTAKHFIGAEEVKQMAGLAERFLKKSL
jgi:hypothetical protein